MAPGSSLSRKVASSMRQPLVAPRHGFGGGALDRLVVGDDHGAGAEAAAIVGTDRNLDPRRVTAGDPELAAQHLVAARDFERDRLAGAAGVDEETRGAADFDRSPASKRSSSGSASGVGAPAPATTNDCSRRAVSPWASRLSATRR